MVRTGTPRKSARATDSMGEILDFMQKLWGLDHQLQSLSKRMRQQHGITGPQRLVIRLVGIFPGISAGELAVRLFVHPSTLTGVFRRLEAQGFLARVPDPNDCRRAVFRLTAKGQHINTLRRGTVEDAVRRSLKAIPEEDRKSALRVLTLLSEVLEQA